MQTHETKSNFLYNLFVETYLKDIINRNNINNSEELSELVNIISSSIGSLTNPTKLSNTFKSVKNVNLSVPTIIKYLEYLTDSFLIHKANRYNIKGKNILILQVNIIFQILALEMHLSTFVKMKKLI